MNRNLLSRLHPETLPYPEKISKVLPLQDYACAEAFWRQALAGFTAPTPLVVGQNSSCFKAQADSYVEQEIQLSAAVTRALKFLAQQHQLNLNVLVQAAWALLLSRYSGSSDVVFGVTRVCPNPKELKTDLMVWVLSTLPVRVHVSPQLCLLPWLKQLQSQWQALSEYEHTPLDKIHEWSDIPPETPLFESLLVFEDYMFDSSSVESEDSCQEEVKFELPVATEYPLTLNGYLETSGTDVFLKLSLRYDQRCFHADTIARILGHVTTLLEGIAANPDRDILALPLLTSSERQQLLVEWNDTAVNYPQDKCIHQLFEEQVALTPDAIAVVLPAIASSFERDEQLTYRELNCIANQLAHYLQQLGVGPDVLVAISLPRSLLMAIAILGILKAGGAYVPLDPAYPQERLAFMLADTQAPIVLTQRLAGGSSGCCASILPDHQARVVCLDTEWEIIRQNSTANPTSHVTPNNLTYVIYTSGSTGQPKGVAIEHSALSNLIFWQVQNSTLTREARTLQFAALSFDVSFQELFSTWCAGGTVVLISEELRRDALSLLRFINREKIERLFLPFIALQHLAEAADTYGQIPATLREVVTAGEQLQINRYLVNLFSQLNNCTLHNQYGPSESHVVTTFTLTGLPSEWSALPPIGRPITNAQVYILDQNQQPVPIGVPGEVHIGGISLARGYLNCPEKTLERFIPNLFSHEPEARLYKTGDIARYLNNGNIEYLGRTDNQVKIRGFRIQLGEVETALTKHSGVKQAVVVVREDQPGTKRLVAYLVPKGRRLVTTDLRDYLLEKLPDYAIPATFVTVEAMPQTPSGKIDRRALPAPDSQRPQLEQTYVAPKSKLECFLANLWSKLLNLDAVGIHDNFFELGGDSLLILQVAAQVQQILEIELPVVKLFQHPTIFQLANYLSQKAGDRLSHDRHQERAQRQKARFDHRKQSLSRSYR